MMHEAVEKYFGKDNIRSAEALAQAGSNRKYDRIHLQTGHSYIVCENDHVAENETFIYFTEVFSAKQIPVPEIVYVHPDKKMYILQDLGNDTLLDLVLQKKHQDSLKALYEQCLKGLVAIQLAGRDIDYSRCFASKRFDRSAVLADLNYFKYYFLDLQEIVYDKAQLNKEYERLANDIDQTDAGYFMYRDFQGRNIMIKDNQTWFIDYQGGMQGPLQYDVASLLWQAKAALPFEWKEELYKSYKSALSVHIAVDETSFDKAYQKILLLRLLQVLGAYGLRGIIQQRSHFLSSIPFGLQNIAEWMQHYGASVADYPTLTEVLKKLSQKSESEVLTEQQNTPALTVTVQSFSYKKGIPDDISGNGGGFMFDCRGILNPGRFEAYKKLTGRDKPVIEFLESKTKIGAFLAHAKNMVDISMEDYISRGFENLQISFGCTGGQHRSVYCTDRMAHYLREKYGVTVNVKHLIQDEKNWIN